MFNHMFVMISPVKPIAFPHEVPLPAPSIRVALSFDFQKKKGKQVADIVVVSLMVSLKIS